MGAKEIDTGRAQAEEAEEERRAGRRFAIILGASILLLFALTVAALYLIFKSRTRQRAQAPVSAAEAVRRRSFL
ncbi:MAG TPA: hypothetical protein VJS44_16160 [Pyrinomonadaceae bacterium]|nr:hypothetical protein [Pyrinomonadaceae bacterium]